MRKFKTNEKVWFISTFKNPIQSNLYEGTIVWKVPKLRYDDDNLYHCSHIDNEYLYEVETKYIYKTKQEAIVGFKRFIQKAIKQNKQKQKKLLGTLERLRKL